MPDDDSNTRRSSPVGYAHADYARSLAEFGDLRHLPRCDGWLLERQIPESQRCDAIGCYPMFSCQDWSLLPSDIIDLGSELVSVSMVPEVFGDFDRGLLEDCFDTVIPFKEHFTCELNRPLTEIVSRHHRRYARKALKEISCEQHPEPAAFLDDWVELHRTLVERHGISGVRAYSRQSFACQLRVPGMVVLRAIHKGRTVGAQLWIVNGDVAYGHVLAFNAVGYNLGAAYALYWFALEYFTDKVRYCDFGGVSGLKDDVAGGLSWFKNGWSTEMRTAYFCGRILDRPAYEELADRNGPTANTFFPAYRTEF